MTNQLATALNAVDETINDLTITNLIDLGFDPGTAYEAAQEPFSIVEDMELEGVYPVVLDPIFDGPNIDEIQWDKLPF